MIFFAFGSSKLYSLLLRISIIFKFGKSKEDKHDKDKAKEIKELLTSVGIQLDESTKSHVLNISEDQLSKLEVIHLENKDGNDYTNTKEKEKGKI